MWTISKVREENLEQISLCYNYLSGMCHLHNFCILRSFVVEIKKTGDMHQTLFIKTFRLKEELNT